MSDKNKNKKKSPEDFIRYRLNKMSGEERNSFERELQKDPFASEAAEGFASASGSEVLQDLGHLQKRLSIRTVRRQGFIYYRLAASVAVLMIISTVFIIIERDQTGKQLSETVVQAEPKGIPEEKSIKEPALANEESDKQMPVAEENEKISVERRSEVENNAIIVTTEEENLAVLDDFESEKDEKSEAPTAFIRSEQLTAPPAAMARAKSSPEPAAAGNSPEKSQMETDSRTLLSLDTSLDSLSDNTIADYSTERSEIEKDLNFSGYNPPRPIDGKPAFKKYIEENIQYPDTSTAGQREVVVARFLIHSDGKLDSIRIVRSPGRLFSDEAIRLIQSGPEWRPAEDNGMAIEEEVRVRIVFNKPE